MNITWIDTDYRTEPFEDVTAGCSGLELYATRDGKTARIGKITFWDAAGQFVTEFIEREIPLDVVERFIQETKKTLRTS